MLSELRQTDRVLVRLPSWLGDLVMAEPALAALVAELGAERLSIAAPGHLLPILDGLYPELRRIPHAGRGGERAQDWRGHALAILFTNSFRSAWVAWRAGIGQRVGWARDARGWLLSDAPRPALERGAKPFGIGRVGRAARYLPRPFGADCQELIGRLGVSLSRSAPRLAPSAEGLQRARERLCRSGLQDAEPYLLASVGSRPGSAKGFPASSWASTFDHLAHLDGRHAGQLEPLLLVVGPGEETCLQEILSLTKHPRLIPVVQPTAALPELLALAAGARAALCTDGGPRHVIAATRTPLACVAGPSDPRHTADHLQLQSILRVELPCGPCHREQCPLVGAEHHACMLRIHGLDFARAALSSPARG